jgi:hypothetical protein
MKAWIVYCGDEWNELTHANTAGKAKVAIMKSIGFDNYIYLGAKRLPGLDDKPITYQNAKDAGF